MVDIRPVRFQLSRRKGFDLQALSRATNGLPAVNCARPGKFGNPFTMAGCREAGFKGDDAAIAARCVKAFEAWIDSPYWRTNWDGPEAEQARAAILSGLPQLGGKNLACWCALPKPGEPDICHAAVLLEIANRQTCEEVTHG
ncbi:DUF4326 domain-containing protein [Methylosinus sp. Ce-a6]|uniref:DUF4326 domain-containing protein n=1 Tax=Methylosinus sp. Ce-a6 TaxID=2172005 RepID=UPI00135CB618|nr:DUF4326 domain-containing protein [Methylosinus sp. Ce-a6]